MSTKIWSKYLLFIFQNKFLDYEKRKVRMNPCKYFVCRVGPLLFLVFHFFICFFSQNDVLRTEILQNSPQTCSFLTAECRQ